MDLHLDFVAVRRIEHCIFDDMADRVANRVRIANNVNGSGAAGKRDGAALHNGPRRHGGNDLPRRCFEIDRIRDLK
jgi:hypothetical protein